MILGASIASTCSSAEVGDALVALVGGGQDAASAVAMQIVLASRVWPAGGRRRQFRTDSI